MPRRDPETGQFLSSGGYSDRWMDTSRIHGRIRSNIPAADLSGAIRQRVDGAEAEIMEFSDILDNDEIFRLRSLQISAILALPTSSTAEGNAQLAWGLGTNPDSSVTMMGNPFYTGTVHLEEGVADIASGSLEQSEHIAVGTLQAEASGLDTVNGAGFGGDIDRDRRQLHLPGGGPAFDRDDELILPHIFDVDGVNDHSVDFSFNLLAHGVIEELD